MMRLPTDVEGFDELSISFPAGEKGVNSVRMEYTASGMLIEVESGEIKFSALGTETVRQVLASVSSVMQPYAQRSGPENVLDPIRKMGQDLFFELFEGRRLTFYTRIRKMAASSRRGLRLRLLIESPELAALPWEFLHDGKDFINLSSRSPVVRLAQPLVLPVSVSSWNQLRILFLTIANDSDQDLADPYISSLKAMTEHLPQIELEIIRNATLDNSLEAVHNRSFEIIVYLGWEASQSQGRQELVFTEKGRYQVMPNAKLLEALQIKSELRLVYLCAGNTDILAGELAKVVPGVIGWRGIITDQAALEFTKGLFTGILKGRQLEVAVTLGRLQIDLAIPGSREWGLPVLYLGTPDGSLFPVEERGFEATPKVEPTDKPTDKEPPENIRNTGEWKKLQLLLDIKLKNLQVLQEQKAGSGNTSSQFIESQIDQTEKDIQGLKNRLENLS